MIVDLPATRYAPAAFTVDAAAADAADAPDADAADADTADADSTAAGPPALTPPAPPAPAATTAGTDTPTIVDVLEFRVWKGCEQWRVRWAGLGSEGDSWERRDVIWAAGAELASRAGQASGQRATLGSGATSYGRPERNS